MMFKFEEIPSPSLETSKRRHALRKMVSKEKENFQCLCQAHRKTIEGQPLHKQCPSSMEQLCKEGKFHWNNESKDVITVIAIIQYTLAKFAIETMRMKITLIPCSYIGDEAAVITAVRTQSSHN